jgi:hypothetical protein
MGQPNNLSEATGFASRGEAESLMGAVAGGTSGALSHARKHTIVEISADTRDAFERPR